MSAKDVDPFFTIPSEKGKLETDTDQICRLLDAKLANERAAWQRANSQRQIIRAASLIFVFLVIIGALAAFYFVSTRVAEHRQDKTQSTSMTDQ